MLPGGLGGNEVDIIIRAVDQASGTIDKISGSTDKFGAAVKTAAAVSGALITTTVAIAAAVKKVTDEYLKCSDTVRTVNNITQQGAEQSSRLVKVLEDNFIATDNLKTVQQALAKQHESLTIPTLAKLSDAYLALNSADERQLFLTREFGRQGEQFAQIMSEGSAAILAQSDALNKNLVLTQKDLDEALKLKKAQEELRNSQEALTYTMAKSTLPAQIELNNFVVKGVDAWQTLGDTMRTTKNIMMEQTGVLDVLGHAWYATSLQAAELLNKINGTSGLVDATTEYDTELEKSIGIHQSHINVMQGEVKIATDYSSLVGGTVPSMKELEVEAFRMQLALDGTFSADDARRIAEYQHQLGLTTQAEYDAEIKAINFKNAIDALHDKNVTITTTLLYNLAGNQVAPSNWADAGVNTGSSSSSASASSGNGYWVPDPSNPGHYMVNPAHKASGGQMDGRYTIVGEGPTGWSDTAEIITPQGQVIPHAQAEAMKRAGMLGGARMADMGIPSGASVYQGHGGPDLSVVGVASRDRKSVV
jgi:hypothetical protein